MLTSICNIVFGPTIDHTLPLLHRAAADNDSAAAARLIACGADVNMANQYGFTALHWAAENNSAAVAKLLIDSGADVNCASDVFLSTPLHEAAKNDSAEVAQLLIGAGANINATYFFNKTPLHDAVYADAVGAARLLIAAGADMHAKDVHGYTVFDIVRKYAHEHKHDMIYLVRSQLLSDDFYTTVPCAAGLTCPICCDTGGAFGRLVCGHVYHVNCIRSWVCRQPTCPMCRQNI